MQRQSPAHSNFLTAVSFILRRHASHVTLLISHAADMAPRRRSTRKATATTTTREPSQQPSEASALSDVPQTNDKDSCPFCSRSESRLQEGEKDTWIQCDKCKTWFHWRCIGQGDDYEALQKWHVDLSCTRIVKVNCLLGTVNHVATPILP